MKFWEKKVDLTFNATWIWYKVSLKMTVNVIVVESLKIGLKNGVK
jgi:hypothetical protein